MIVLGLVYKLQMSNKSHIIFLTGAGNSAESGLATFRDSGGLWEGFNIEEVASPEGFENNPKQVLDFYNVRRKQAFNAKPNAAHFAIAELEKTFDVTVITQNVDDLHERAGSTNVIHLHGELSKARSVNDENLIVEWGDRDLNLGDIGSDGAQLRPHIVWFGEMVPMLENAINIMPSADILVVVGTSLVVYPAASLIHYVGLNTKKYIVDPDIPKFDNSDNWTGIKEKATVGMKKLTQELITNYV